MKINLFEPYIDDAEEKAVLETLRSKFWASGAGVGNVSIFENKFKKYTNANECLAVNSGTAALNIALSLLDIKNKEVVIPSLSFISTANCVLLNGGIPKFVDVDPKTLCIDPESIEKSITKKEGQWSESYPSKMVSLIISSFVNRLSRFREYVLNHRNEFF